MSKKDSAEKTEGTALTVADAAQLPAEFLGMLEEDAGKGVSTSPDEVGIPFLYILQDMSPQVKKRDPQYVEGAEVGDIYNNVTREVIPASVGIEFIACGFEAAQVEWKPNRGGFAGKHPHDTPLLAQKKPKQEGDKVVMVIDNGNILTETKYHYGFFRRRGSQDRWEMCVIGMASSMIKNSRELEGMKRRTYLPSGKVAPAFSRIYNFSTKLVSKDGKDWFVWEIAQDRWVNGEEYAAGKAFAESIERDGVKTATPGDETAAGGAGDGGGGEDETVL